MPCAGPESPDPVAVQRDAKVSDQKPRHPKQPWTAAAVSKRPKPPTRHTARTSRKQQNTVGRQRRSVEASPWSTGPARAGSRLTSHSLDARVCKAHDGPVVCLPTAALCRYVSSCTKRGPRRLLDKVTTRHAKRALIRHRTKQAARPVALVPRRLQIGTNSFVAC